MYKVSFTNESDFMGVYSNLNFDHIISAYFKH